MNPIDLEKKNKPRPDLIPFAVLAMDVSPLLRDLVKFAIRPRSGEYHDLIGTVCRMLRTHRYALYLEVGRVLQYGYQKHGECTWRIAGTDQSLPQTHYASAVRHALEYLSDPDAVEEGSQIPVIYHFVAQVMIVFDLMNDPPSGHGNDGRWEVGYLYHDAIPETV